MSGAPDEDSDATREPGERSSRPAAARTVRIRFRPKANRTLAPRIRQQILPRVVGRLPVSDAPMAQLSRGVPTMMTPNETRAQ